MFTNRFFTFSISKGLAKCAFIPASKHLCSIIIFNSITRCLKHFFRFYTRRIIIPIYKKHLFYKWTYRISRNFFMKLTSTIFYLFNTHSHICCQFIIFIIKNKRGMCYCNKLSTFLFPLVKPLNSYSANARISSYASRVGIRNASDTL